MRSHPHNEYKSTRKFAMTNVQLMRVQSNSLGRRFNANLNLDKPLEAKTTTKLKIEKLDVVVDGFDAGSCYQESLAMED